MPAHETLLLSAAILGLGGASIYYATKYNRLLRLVNELRPIYGASGSLIGFRFSDVDPDIIHVRSGI